MNPKITDLEAPVKNVGKARTHVSQNEGLDLRAIRARQARHGTSAARRSRGRSGRMRSALNSRATSIEGFPEVSEIEVIRHFTRLSTWNYAIDLGMYPLGSCTMKYNPRVNEFVARLDGLATEHP